MITNFNFKRNNRSNSNKNYSNTNNNSSSNKYLVNNSKNKLRNSFLFTKKNKKNTTPVNHITIEDANEVNRNQSVNNSYNAIAKKIELINSIIELDNENNKIMISSDNFELFKKIIRYKLKTRTLYSLSILFIIF